MTVEELISLGVCLNECDWDPVDCLDCGKCHYDLDEDDEDKDK